MRPSANDRVVIGMFIALAVSSVGLKAWAGPPRDGLIDRHPGQLEDQLVRSLQSQGFATRLRPFKLRSSVVFATRGQCRLSVRNARDGAADMTIFARDASGIGSVRYLYGGQTYPSPPTFAMRAGRLKAELLNRFGLSTRARVPVALAASPACGGSDFGLDDMRVVG